MVCRRMRIRARNVPERTPPDLAKAIDFGRGRGKGVGSAREQVVMPIEDQRLPQEGAQHQILPWMLPKVSA